jgi:hypothetical protein
MTVTYYTRSVKVVVAAANNHTFTVTVTNDDGLGFDIPALKDALVAFLDEFDTSHAISDASVYGLLSDGVDDTWEWPVTP